LNKKKRRVEIDWIVVICYFCDKCKRQVVQLTGQKTSPEKICLEEGKKVILIVVFEMCALHLKWRQTEVNSG